MFRLTLLLLTISCFSQDFGTRTRQMIMMDVTSGAIVAGVGSAIHKPKGKTIAGAFLSGAWKGAIGGCFTFYGKYQIYQMKNKRDLTYAWPCKIVHAIGASMIENGARGQKLYTNFAIDFGPVRFDIGKYKQRVRFQPVAAGSMGIMFIQGYKFNFKNSLKTGVMYFVGEGKDTPSGKNIGNSIMVNKTKNYKSYSFYSNKYSTAGHEVIHTFQFREMQAMNVWLMPNRSRFIYWDLPTYMIPYGIGEIQHRTGGRYYSNPYELQSETLSRRDPVNWTGREKINRKIDLPN